MQTPSKILSERSYVKPPSRDDYLLVTFSLLLMLVFLAFAIRPSVLTAYKLFRTISEYKALDYKMTDKMIALETIREQLPVIQEYEPLLETAVPKTPKEGDFLSSLNALAAKHSVQIYDFSQKSDPNTQGLLVTLETRGSFENIKTFVEDMNNLLRIVHVQGVTLNTINSSKGSTDELSAGITVHIFYEE